MYTSTNSCELYIIMYFIQIKIDSTYVLYGWQSNLGHLHEFSSVVVQKNALRRISV